MARPAREQPSASAIPRTSTPVALPAAARGFSYGQFLKGTREGC